MKDINLMIVEDDKELRELLSKILSREIDNVKSFSQPSEALREFENFRPDLILTDIKMPGMNGLEMVAVIREIYENIPVIIVSAFSEPKYFLKAIELKVNHFLTKPIDIEKLIDMIKTIANDLSIKDQLDEQKKILTQYKHIVDLSSNITITDIEGKITYVNDRFCVLSGYTRSELLGKSHSIVRHPDMKKSFFEKLWRKILNKQVWRGIIKNRRKDGTDFFVETTIAPVLNNNNQIMEFVSIKTDITNIVLSKEKLQEQIVTDKLTSLPNRIQLQEDILKFETSTLIVFDINHFKEINLLFGVNLGDETLMYFANTLQDLALKIKDSKVYRISADEFAIHKQGDNIQEFEKFSYKLQEYIKENFFSYNEISFDINFTCAIAYKNEKSQNLLESTLDALDSAKNSNQFLHIFDELASKQNEYKQNFEWTKKIKDALADNRIRAYFQPIFSVEENKIVKYEALVRLIEEDGTVISPFVFLNIAKHSRLYFEITKTVILQACETFASRVENVTINVSIEDLLDETIIDYFIDTVKKYKMNGRVVAEVLESEGIENFDVFSKVLTRLKDNDIRVAIDDFGSGYSNFSYLISMDIDILKIDGSLIRYINEDVNSKIVVQSIIMFAHQLGMRVVAEFVSDKKIFEELKSLGVDFLQGYYVSEPLETPLAEDVALDI